MKITRIISGLIGFPLVVLLLVFGNIYLIDIAFAIVALIAMKEYLNAFSKKAKPVKWIRIFILFDNRFYSYNTIELFIFNIWCFFNNYLLILFTQLIITNMKINLYDIIITFLEYFI
jgi:CDP-diglyceride synthetase